jgi:hypothetical protein
MSARLFTDVTLLDASGLLKVDYHQVMPEIAAQEAAQLGAKLETVWRSQRRRIGLQPRSADNKYSIFSLLHHKYH